MKSAAVVLAVALAVGTPVFAQSTMTLDTFVTQANRIPMNPLAAVRPDARRLVGVAGRAFDAVEAAAQAIASSVQPRWTIEHVGCTTTLPCLAISSAGRHSRATKLVASSTVTPAHCAARSPSSQWFSSARPWVQEAASTTTGSSP